MKQVRKKHSGTISITSKWSLIVTVYLLFNRFHWSKSTVKMFLRKYAEASDNVVPFNEESISADERTKIYGLSFNEYRESNGLNLEMKNKMQDVTDGKIEKRIAFYQDNIIKWILDVIADTLQSVGWYGEEKEKTIRKFAEMYDAQIKKLQNEQEIIKMMNAVKNDYDFDLEIEMK